MKRILPLLALLLSCCAAPYNSRFSDLQPGMPRSQVTALLGKPVSAAAMGGTEMLYYRLASSFLDTDGSDTREYWVELQRGNVTAYGERNDQAAQDRSRRQFKAAWGVVGGLQKTQELLTPRQINVNENVNVQGHVTHDVNGTLYLVR